MITQRLRFERLEDRRMLAGTPELLKDIVVGLSGSSPSNFVQVGSLVYFVANDGAHGRELWKSDGTAAGTKLFKDIVPGSNSSYPNSLANVNGTLFFSADDGVNGAELWKSNGTSAGTILVKNIYPGSSGSYPDLLTNVNGTLYFTVDDDGVNGNELWRSDGTANGTTLVKNIGPGDSGSDVEDLTNVNGTLFFSANDGTTGPELWRSDGTSSGTTIVKDIQNGSIGSDPDFLVNVNGKLFFSADNGINGNELWRSDGTSGGTTLVKDIFPGIGSSYPGSLTNVNGTLFFRANDGTHGSELWKSDDTAAGTTLVKNINPEIVGSPPRSSTPADLANVNGTLFFRANDGVHCRELWKSEGTSTSTTLVKDILSGIGDSHPDHLTNLNGTLFFSANDGSHGEEVWVLRPATGSVSLAIATASANKNEGNSGSTLFTFTVTRSGNISGATTVNYAVTGVGSSPATASDFVGNVFRTGTVTFAAGQATRVITIPVRGDTTVESNEAFRVTLSGASGGASITTAAANGVIRNDDTALAIAATSANRNEGKSGTTAFTFTVTRTGVLTGATTVNYAATGVGTSPAAASDFVGNAFPNDTVTFAAGQATRVITIFVRGDTTVESSETFRVTLSGASSGATITTPAANGVIRNDDTSLAIAATSANKNEGNSGSTPFTFTVTRSGNVSGTTTVNYAVTGVGASPATANDFVGNAFPSGTVTFAAGQATRVITIPVRGDALVESNETFRVTLSGASGGATITTPAANGVIRNDDTSLAIAPTSANKNEGNVGTNLFTFTVTRSGLLTNTTTVDYAVTGIGASPAAASDFVGNVLPTGTVTFAPGDTTKVISIRVRGDVTAEANEAFRVTLSNPSFGASITTAFVSGLIRNDD